MVHKKHQSAIAVRIRQ